MTSSSDQPAKGERIYIFARRAATPLLRIEASILIALALYLATASTFKTVTHPFTANQTLSLRSSRLF